MGETDRNLGKIRERDMEIQRFQRKKKDGGGIDAWSRDQHLEG